jgi:hypothetical protein
MMKFVYPVLVIMLAAAGCMDTAPDQNTNLSLNSDSVRLITTGIDLTPSLAAVDSIAILFYKDPFGGEADRYTRYYTQYNATSDSVIHWLKANMAEPFKEDTLRQCRSEGKIFCFVNGKPVQTVYFTHQSETCDHLYLIHTGRYYYLPFNQQLESRLKQLKTLAVSP